MGRPSQQFPYSSALGSSANLSIQHERLILELLPLKDASQFHDWLSGPFVRGSWNEFCRDYLNDAQTAPEPDKQKASQAAKDAINGKNAKYLVYHPLKDGWTVEDHTIRFIATVVADNMIKNMWSESDWKKKNLEITRAVYEVLSYLRGTSLRAEQASSSSAHQPLSINPPRYED